MVQVSTVNSYQGKEEDLIVLVTGTTIKSGPCFTSNLQHLNISMTRQRYGLVVMGAIGVAGKLDEVSKKPLAVKQEGGDMSYIRVGPLKDLINCFTKSGRVAHVEATPHGVEDSSSEDEGGKADEKPKAKKAKGKKKGKGKGKAADKDHSIIATGSDL